MRLWRVLGVFCLVGVLAGCTGNSAPKPSPYTPPPVTESASPPPKAAWEFRTPRGAKAFVIHWFAVFDEAKTTGDARPMRRLSSVRCWSCRSIATHVERIYDRGGYHRSRGWQVTHATQIAKPTARSISFLLTIRQSAESVRETATSKIENNPAVSVDYTVDVEWLVNGWLLREIRFTAS